MAEKLQTDIFREAWTAQLPVGLFLWPTLAAIVLMGATAILVWSFSPTSKTASAVKHHYCTQLAEQVAASDIGLDRYITTDCSLTILANVEGL